MNEKTKEYQIKKVLLEKGPLRFKEISRLTGISEPTVAKWLKRLEKEGEVVRTVLPDKSGVYYKLVDKKFYVAELFVSWIVKSMVKKLTELEKDEEFINVLKKAGRDWWELVIWLIGEALFASNIGIEDEEIRNIVSAILVDELKGYGELIAEKGGWKEELQEKHRELIAKWMKLDIKELEELSRKFREEARQTLEERLPTTSPKKD